jgi:hypothetical protein
MKGGYTDFFISLMGELSSVAPNCDSVTAFNNVIGNITDEKFENISHVMDWRNYVPDACIQNWDELTVVTKMVIYSMAEKQAQNEEWD